MNLVNVRREIKNVTHPQIVEGKQRIVCQSTQL
jgi:hypothetical protein